jgi:uncharacterized protein YggU (UPF0235/DUF167 family)
MYIKVKVITGAKQEKIEKKAENSFNIWVKEKAERNRANNRVCEIIASIFSVSSKTVRIINGHHSPSKLISITSIN